MMNELEKLLLLPDRKIIVTLNEINLLETSENKVFLLIVEESRGAAGGRGGGSGHRKIARIIGFNFGFEGTKKIFDAVEQEIINKFEIPYSAVAMDIKLSEGKEYVVQGIVDPAMIESYENVIKNCSKKNELNN
ncbi:MAG: hypothetical protein R3321_13020 [Nitrososphaeraceae archaeon]|nr:hypothetical protein [Nitrososphaeraceae archaeon]